MEKELKEFIEWIGFSKEVEACWESGVKKWFIDDTTEVMTTEELFEYYKNLK